MPSGEHETPIALAKLDPGLLAGLLANVFDLKVPDYHHAEPRATDVRVVVPATVHADGMLVFYDADNKALLAVVLEIQLRDDKSPDGEETKQWTWKLYTAQLEYELKVNVVLLVYCPRRWVARYYENLFKNEGLSLSLRPYIFTPADVPLVVDAAVARANPALAVFSAICHRSRAKVDSAFPALAEAIEAVGPEKGQLYYDIVLAGLPQAPRVRWEAFMTTAPGYRWLSKEFRERDARSRAEGKAEGEAQGEGRALLTVLDARGVSVPDAVREQILASTDLSQLDTWLRRAATATTADEVVRP